MKYSETCECCGHKLTAYTHKLNKPLVLALAELVAFYIINGRPAKLQQDLELTKNQYNNFQKLQYFKLVHRDEQGWTPTHKGTAFVKMECSCQDTVATMGKEILNGNHPAWETHAKAPRWIMADQFIEVQYKQREEYQQEKGYSRNLFS